MKRTRPILAELFRQVRDPTQNVSIRPHFSKPQFVSPENSLSDPIIRFGWGKSSFQCTQDLLNTHENVYGNKQKASHGVVDANFI